MMTIQQHIEKMLTRGSISFRDEEDGCITYKINRGFRIDDKFGSDIYLITVNPERDDWVSFTTCDGNDGYEGDVNSLRHCTTYQVTHVI